MFLSLSSHSSAPWVIRGPRPSGGIQPAAQDGYECGPTQNHLNLFKPFFFNQFSLVFVYLMCGPRQLFFEYGRDTKGWTPRECGWGSRWTSGLESNSLNRMVPNHGVSGLEDSKAPCQVGTQALLAHLQ